MEAVEMDIGALISQYGFPIIAAIGLGYFIYYIWQLVTTEVDPVVHESHMTLIALIDRIRMLDNDLIRLNAKLDMVIQQQKEAEVKKPLPKEISKRRRAIDGFGE